MHSSHGPLEVTSGKTVHYIQNIVPHKCYKLIWNGSQKQ